jgi:hypothetical protein
MTSKGQCDCCGANDVELSFSVAYGIETWSCTEGCDAPEGAEPLEAYRRGSIMSAAAEAARLRKVQA